MSFEPIVLAPEEEIEEIYPYRRVWRTSSFEIIILLSAVGLIYILTNLVGVIPANYRQPFPKVGIALLPLIMWVLISFRSERRAPQPRAGLVTIVLLGALVANGIAIPLEEHLFISDQWLPKASFFGRILGYMMTMGFTAEFLKYAVVRYTVWPQHFRQRLDGVAFSQAASIGFAVVLNTRFALLSDATWTATALRVASVTCSQLAIGLIMGFFLAELRIGRPPIFWLPAGLLLASFLSGLYYAFRSIVIVSSLNVGESASTPVRGLALAIGFVAITFVVIAFIIESADARMEALTGRRQTI